MELRPIQPGQELKQLEELLNSAFPVPAHGSFFDDFPVWDPRHSVDCVRLGAFEKISGKETLVSSALGRPAFLHTSEKAVGIWVIGGVATLPNHRGQGLASMLVSSLIDAGQSRKSRLSVLWGSELSMYSKLGFELFGTQLRIPIAELLKGGVLRPDAEIHRGWTSSLMRFFLARSEGLALTEKDALWISAHRNVDWWWIGPEESPAAILGYGRGMDLPGIVHEWGGEKKALLQLMSAFLSENPQAQLIGSEKSFIQNGFPVSLATREHLCLCRRLGEAPVPDFWFWGLDGA